MTFFSFTPLENGKEEFRVSKLYWLYRMYPAAETRHLPLSLKLIGLSCRYDSVDRRRFCYMACMEAMAAKAQGSNGRARVGPMIGLNMFSRPVFSLIFLDRSG